MYPNSFGDKFKITTFGESHSVAMGIIIEGVRANVKIDIKEIQNLLDKRKPKKKLTTLRKEDDKLVILSGIFEGKTLGSPIVALIYNKDAKPKDYSKIKDIFRPSHADFTFFKKYGIRDYRGGGRSSGRETVSRVAGGAVAISFLNDKNIKITSKIIQISPFKTNKWDEINEDLPFADKDQVDDIKNYISSLQGDSIGAIIETRIDNLPIGIGEPVFEKLNANLAKAILGIGSVKGIEFGEGFNFANLKGSEANDQMNESGFISNHSGGIQGGISNGETIIFKSVIKPTPSISKPQNTINENNEKIKIKIKGRHDPCIAIRIIPVINSMTAITLLNLIDHHNLSSAVQVDPCTDPTSDDRLPDLRETISNIDISIFTLLEERFNIVKKIIKHKKQNNIKIENKDIEEKLLNNIKNLKFKNLKDEFINKIYRKIFNESKKIQKND